MLFLQINLIYLGLITDRVPIIAEFIPSHIGGHVPPIPFGQVRSCNLDLNSTDLTLRYLMYHVFEICWGRLFWSGGT
jgi:hypothetical protein